MGLPQIGCRHVLVLWGFLGFVIVYMLRINLSVALVVMVNSTAAKNTNQDKECPDKDNGTQIANPVSKGANFASIRAL